MQTKEFSHVNVLSITRDVASDTISCVQGRKTDNDQEDTSSPSELPSSQTLPEKSKSEVKSADEELDSTIEDSFRDACTLDDFKRVGLLSSSIPRYLMSN